jgi:hypothetical protein
MKKPKSKKTIKLAEKKLKKANKWLQKFDGYDMGHMDGTFNQVQKTKELCEMILEVEEMKKQKERESFII